MGAEQRDERLGRAGDGKTILSRKIAPVRLAGKWFSDGGVEKAALQANM